MPKNRTDAVKRVFELIATLRGENGCPWDRAQSLDDVLSDLVEEAYELEWANTHLARHDLLDEMGDVFFLLCFAIAIEQETSPDFDIDNIAAHAYDKIKSRHPHVFEGETADTAEESLVFWERVKTQERAAKAADGGVFEGVPGNLPPLRLAEKIQERAASIGFDWDDPAGIIAKLREEIDELEDSIQSGARADVREELGDLLFSVVNMTRFLKIDANAALNQSTSKFIRRFQQMEGLIDADGKRMREMTLEEMDVYWERAKNS